MRLKADIWVKAYIRRCSTVGIPAMVVRHGDDDAGAIFIKIALLNGQAHLYGPAPAGIDDGAIDRRWSLHLDAGSVKDADVDAHLARQIAYDPDLWIVEVEDRQGRHFLDDWL
jgi:hypothetical protein